MGCEPRHVNVSRSSWRGTWPSWAWIKQRPRVTWCGSRLCGLGRASVVGAAMGRRRGISSRAWLPSCADEQRDHPPVVKVRERRRGLSIVASGECGSSQVPHSTAMSAGSWDDSLPAVTGLRKPSYYGCGSLRRGGRVGVEKRVSGRVQAHRHFRWQPVLATCGGTMNGSAMGCCYGHGPRCWHNDLRVDYLDSLAAPRRSARSPSAGRRRARCAPGESRG
jgi:hypothetical protein